MVAVSTDVTVAGQNLERKGGSGDCLGPDHFRKQLLWQCVMTSLSQLNILEFMALLASSFASWRHCRNRKLSAQSLPKTCFLLFLGSGGYPHVKNAVCEKRPGPVLAPGPPSGATLHVPGPEKTVWEGVWKTRQKNDANMAHKRGGWNTESKAFVRECWKKSQWPPSAKRRVFRESGGPQNDAKKTPGAPLYSPWGVQGALCGLREATFVRTVFQRLFCTIFLYFWGPAGGPKSHPAAPGRGTRA